MNKRHETRAYEVRAAESPLVIEGTAIVFDQPADMHGFSERIARSALEHVDLNDITLLVNHDGTGIPLARSPKTLTLNVTDNGLEMRAELLPIPSRDAAYMKPCGAATCRRCPLRSTLRIRYGTNRRANAPSRKSAKYTKSAS